MQVNFVDEDHIPSYVSPSPAGAGAPRAQDAYDSSSSGTEPVIVPVGAPLRRRAENVARATR